MHVMVCSFCVKCVSKGQYYRLKFPLQVLLHHFLFYCFPIFSSSWGTDGWLSLDISLLGLFSRGSIRSRCPHETHPRTASTWLSSKSIYQCRISANVRGYVSDLFRRRIVYVLTICELLHVVVFLSYGYNEKTLEMVYIFCILMVKWIYVAVLIFHCSFYRYIF